MKPERKCVLAIDQGTTSTRAVVFDAESQPVAMVQKELTQIYPRSGWVEHDPGEIWQKTLEVCREAVDRAGQTPSGLGITNQRETTLVWEADTGRPVHNAIVWQDRRTAPLCQTWLAAGLEKEVQSRTGLLVDPYFSASKLVWLLENVPGLEAKAREGQVKFGTVDSWLIWCLSGGRLHLTDASNASRTMLFNLRSQDWDRELLAEFGIPEAVLPEVVDSSGEIGLSVPELFGRPVPIAGLAGDQQAALIGQCCFEPGQIKSTYGTGCFALLNTGSQAVVSTHRLLTTVAYRLAGQTTFALEGSIFVAGSAIQWLRDRLGVIQTAAESETLARQADPESGVYLVPAFSGLGAPHWDPQARGALTGLSHKTGRAEVARAALEAVGYQTRDLIEAMVADAEIPPRAIRVDGGMAANDWAMQFLADILDLEVQRPGLIETTALGAAYLAGLALGIYPGPEELAGRWRLERTFSPSMDPQERARRFKGWQEAVKRVRSAGPV